jgi:hypothetical protein
MINIDSRALEALNPNEMWLMLHIVKRINTDRTAFPSKKTLLKDTGWKSEKTVNAAISGLIEKGMLQSIPRQREDGSQTSNLYRITTNLFGVYKPANELQDMVKNAPGGVQKMQGGGGKKDTPGGVQKMYPHEVLDNSKVLVNEVLESSFSNEKGFRENSTERIGDVAAEFEQFGEPSPLKAQKKETPPKLREAPPAAKEPTETYLMYEAWARFVEAKGIAVAKNATGTSYQFAPKDGSAIKKWREWCAGLPNATGSLDDWQVFLQAAWEHGGKWYQSNFTPCILNSKRQELMAAFARYKAKNEPDMSLVGLSIDEILKNI